MTSQNTTQRLHVAIALAILSHKPPQQTLSSYLIDLKTRFPTVTTHSSHDKYHKLPPDEDNPWRKRALQLEQENEELKLRVEKQEFAALASKLSSEDQADNNANQHSSQAPKKKRKVQTAMSNILKERYLRILATELQGAPSLPMLKDSLDVITSFRLIQSIDAGRVQSETDGTILIQNIKRSLVALGNLLSVILDKKASMIATSSLIDATGCLRDLLLCLFNSTLPLRPPHSILSHILGDLNLCIVRPIIQGFHNVSLQEFAVCLKGRGQKSTVPDIRPDLLGILKNLLEELRALKASTRSLQEFMIFETTKEIETLWKPPTEPAPITRDSRIARMVRKDSLWYHCSILHVALDRFPSPMASDTSDRSLLSAAAVQTLAGLIHHFESQEPVDEVAEGMVLAVIEKAWLMGLYEPPIGSEEELT